MEVPLQNGEGDRGPEGRQGLLERRMSPADQVQEPPPDRAGVLLVAAALLSQPLKGVLSVVGQVERRERPMSEPAPLVNVAAPIKW